MYLFIYEDCFDDSDFLIQKPSNALLSTLFPTLQQWDDLPCHQLENNSIVARTRSSGEKQHEQEEDDICDDNEPQGGDLTQFGGGAEDVDGGDDDDEAGGDVSHQGAEDDMKLSGPHGEDPRTAGDANRAIVHKFVSLVQREMGKYGNDSLSSENKFMLSMKFFYS
jgi:hypothetical protein